MQAIASVGGHLTPEVATGLLTAIAMDTGWFRHSNTRAGTFRAAAELIDAGTRADQIYRQLFDRNTPGRLRLMGETLVGLKTDLNGRVAYAVISLDDLARTGAIPPDSEDLVDYTVSMRGVDVGMLFIEQARGGVKVSFRARNGLDCSQLAARFGGGGHREAAGATIPGPLSSAVERVLSEVRARRSKRMACAERLEARRDGRSMCHRAGKPRNAARPGRRHVKFLARQTIVNLR